jgi:hypothetical protein
MPPPPRYEKYVEIAPVDALLSLATNASGPPAFALWNARVLVGMVKSVEVVYPVT